MTELFQLHRDFPQRHLLLKAVAIIRRGGVIVYPTDSGYALGCRMGEKDALARIRQIRHLETKHHFTLVCRDLSELATYAMVNNSVFRLLKAYTPGPYTFILPATKELPKRLLHPKRRTIGLRVPDHPIAQALLELLEEPLMSTTLIVPDTKIPLIEPEAIRDLLGKQVDLVLGGGYCGLERTTVVDLSEETPKVIRTGKGDPTPFL